MAWSNTWNASKSPRKQRNYVAEAPLHIQSKMMGSTLTKDLRTKMKTRTMRVRKGDKVKVLRGQYKGKMGTVERVNTEKQKVYITGIDRPKKDGSKTLLPIHASNIVIQELAQDKKRTGEKK